MLAMLVSLSGYSTVLNVTSTADAGAGSLRDQVAAAVAGDQITFASSTNGTAIVLTSGAIAIDKNLVFLGNGITNTLIDGNNTSGVFNITAGNVTFNNLTIQHGVTNKGGGINHTGSGVISIENCLFNSCAATGDGGGIFNASGTMNISACTFDGNHADFDGGGIRINGGTVTITTSTFTNGTTGFSGAGIRRYGGTVTVTNSTLSGNNAGGNGGGFEGNMTLTNCTIANNSAANGGGAKPAGSTFTNCIVYNNSAAGAGPDLDGGISSGGYNIIGNISGSGGLSGTDQIANPLLSALANNGGPTQTMAIQCGSPAIDAANPATSGTDQRGLPMFNVRRDIGAFESQVCINTWTGVNTSWTNPVNWTFGVPTGATDAVITATPVSGNNFPVITSGVAVNNLTVQANATLTVANAGALTLNGTLANAGAVTIQNGGNFLQGSSSSYSYAGTFKVEKSITNSANGYRDISSPVATTVADLADNFPVFGTDGVQCWYSYSPYPNVQTYNEALSLVTGDYNEGWVSNTGNSNPLLPLQGVAMRTYHGGPFTLDFTGTPNNGAQTINITKTNSATTSQDGWNFVGNAYPSNIDWVSVAAMNPGITGSYYIFGTTGEYTGAWGTCNSSGACTGTGVLSGISQYISAGQGFFVRKSTTGSGSFVMNNTVRTSNAAVFYKTYALSNEIRLSITDGTNNDEILAYTDANATAGDDQGLDAIKMVAGSTVSIGYVNAGGVYAIDALDEITESTVLPLEVLVTNTGSYTVTPHLNLTGLKAYLKDDATNTLYDLSTTTPSFTLTGGVKYSSRFSVVFKTDAATGVSVVTENPTHIFSNANKVIVERTSTETANIVITNLLGQEIANVKSGDARTEISLNTPSLSYAIVKVTEGGKVSVAKVSINNAK